MSEAGIDTEELAPASGAAEGKKARLMGWLSRKVGLGPKPELKVESQQTTEAPLLVAGGETDAEPQPQEASGAWRTDTTDRLDRAEREEPVRDAEGLTKKDKFSLLTGQGGPPNELESLNRSDELIALAAAGTARQRPEREKPVNPAPSQKPVRPSAKRTA